MVKEKTAPSAGNGVWAVVRVWLIALGCTVGLSALLSGGDAFGGFICALLIAMFSIPAAAVVTGVKAARGRANANVGVAAVGVVCLGLLYSCSDGLRMTLDWQDAALSVAPIFIWLLAFSVEKLRIRLNRVCTAASVTVSISAIVLCFFAGYLILAFQSTTAFSFFPEEMFFTRDTNDITSVSVDNAESLLRREDGSLFTGEIKSYKKRLALDFISKSVSGAAYYIDGRLFGTSGDVVPAGRYSSRYGSYAGTKSWNLLAPENVGFCKPVLLHKKYQDFVEKELKTGKIVYYAEVAKEKNFSSKERPLPEIQIVFVYPDRIERKEISFYDNGVVDRIESVICTGEGWQNGGKTLGFDSLGYRKDIASEETWKAGDFVLSDFSALDILRHAEKAAVPLGSVESFTYVPSPEKAVYGNLADDLIAVYDIPVTTVFCRVLNKEGYWDSLSKAEGEVFLELIGRSSLDINILDDFWKVYDFQEKSIQFKISGKDDEHSVSLYYKDGKALIANGPYYLNLSPDSGGQYVPERTRLFPDFLDVVRRVTPESGNNVKALEGKK